LVQFEFLGSVCEIEGDAAEDGTAAAEYAQPGRVAAEAVVVALAQPRHECVRAATAGKVAACVVRGA